MTDVIMPTLSLTMEEGTITEWLKREGDTVTKDEPLFVVEMDKASMEVPAPASGVLTRIIAQAGSTVPVRQAIAIIGEAGESAGPAGDRGSAAVAGPAPAQSLQPPAAPAASQAPAMPAAPAPSPASVAAPPPRPPGERLFVSPRARRVAVELGVDIATLRGSGPEGRIVERDVRAATVAAPPAPAAPERILASPLARKLAAEHNVDLATLQGSGPGGRIVEKDVMTAMMGARDRGPGVGEVAPAAPAPPPTPAQAEPAPTPSSQLPAPTAVQPLSRLRRITAERMAASARAVARVTLFMPVDMSEAVRFRGQLAPEFERRYGARLGYDAMIAKAAAIALRDHAELNAQWAEGAIRPLEQVNIGTAVALDEGLLVVVVRDADAKPLHAIQAELRDLVEKARAGRLTPDDVAGSTFTITNLGGYGVEAFTPIVNLPEAGILGVGRIAKGPAVVDDQLTIRDQMTLSLAFDHRVTDGTPAARFLQRLKEVLEAPYILLT